MLEEETTRKGDLIGHNGKPIHGGTSMQNDTKSYALFLKDQWMQFQIKTLAQHGTMPFKDYKQFVDLCDKSSHKYMNVWDPNTKLGYLYFMAIASWMNHENAKAKKVR